MRRQLLEGQEVLLGLVDPPQSDQSFHAEVLPLPVASRLPGTPPRIHVPEGLDGVDHAGMIVSRPRQEGSCHGSHHLVKSTRGGRGCLGHVSLRRLPGASRGKRCCRRPVEGRDHQGAAGIAGQRQPPLGVVNCLVPGA